MLVEVNNLEDPHFLQMVQDYEGEFAKITGKEKEEDGTFSLDTDPSPPNSTYLWLEDGKKVGFCIRTFYSPYSDIGEFYVIPEYRNKGVGTKLAFAVFDRFPGPWQVRQIEGADEAKVFWRTVISAYTNGSFVETEEDDPTWGRVTCQRFSSEKGVS